MIFPLHQYRHWIWGERIEQLATVIGKRAVTMKQAFGLARKHLGWSQRRTRCVISAAEDARFRWHRSSNRWIVIPGERGIEWSNELSRWVAKGHEEEAAHDARVDVQELAAAADRIGGNIKAARPVDVDDVEVEAIPVMRAPPPRPRVRGQLSILEAV